MDRRIIDLYYEYTHRPLPRRVFLRRLAGIAGGSAAAMALLPLLENNWARAALVDPNDARLETGRLEYPGAGASMRAYYARPRRAAAKLPAGACKFAQPFRSISNLLSTARTPGTREAIRSA